MKDLSLDGLAVAPGVIETIVAIAVKDIEGLESIKQTNVSVGLRAMFSQKGQNQGIEVSADDDGKLHVAVHIEVKSGYALPDLADQVREAIADAVAVQVGIPIGSVDVYVDGITFEK